jgi:subtilase family serine protease
MLALETQVMGAALGNVNPRLYELAQLQYANPVLLKSCNSTLGKNSSSGCIFHNVTAGDNAEPCYAGTANCHTTTSSTSGVGVLAATDGKNAIPAFPAGAGYSLATGLGTLNAANLLYNF